MNPTQTVYLLVSLQYASLGDVPLVAVFSRQEDAQAQWDNIAQSSDWGVEVDYLQILTIPATVIQATTGSPSGEVTLPADPGTGD